MTRADLSEMPLTLAEIGGKGIRFDRTHVEVPLCAPSRVSILTGRYAHNTQVYNNTPAAGGFWRYQALGLATQSLPYWLRSAGYETGLVGKFFNGYGGTLDKTVIPPGWSWWMARRDSPHPHRNFNYSLYENGRIVTYGSSATDYATDVYLRKGKEFLKLAKARRKPFLLLFDPHAPHTPAEPAPRHASMFMARQVPRTPNFREADMSDKPTFFRDRLLTDDEVASLDGEYKSRLRSLQAVDEAVRGLVETLRILGQLDNTYIFFLSDNGFHMGLHQLPGNKELAYQEDNYIPLLVRGPGIPQGVVDSSHFVLNIDLAPTIAGLAGVTVPAGVDGRSLVPLWTSGNTTNLAWRRAFPLLRVAVPEPGTDPYAHMSMTAVRTGRYTWVEWSNGERELYDNVNDPYQLQSLHDAAAIPDETLTGDELRAALSTLTGQLAGCSGQGCRDLENAAAP